MPTRVQQIGVRQAGHSIDEVCHRPPAGADHGSGLIPAVTLVDVTGPVINLREIGRGAAAADGFQPLDLLAPELSVVRDDRHRSPPLRAAGGAAGSGGQQKFLLQGGEGGEPDDRFSQTLGGGHVVTSAAALRAMNLRFQSTITVIFA